MAADKHPWTLMNKSKMGIVSSQVSLVQGFARPLCTWRSKSSGGISAGIQVIFDKLHCQLLLYEFNMKMNEFTSSSNSPMSIYESIIRVNFADILNFRASFYTTRRKDILLK